MKHLFLYSSLFFLFIFYSGCDATSEPPEILSDNGGAITSFRVGPGSINFDPNIDGIRDTTVNFSIELSYTGSLSPDVNASLKITEQNSGALLKDSLITVTTSDQDRFAFDFSTLTTQTSNLLFEVFITDESGEIHYAQSNSSVTGFSNQAPVILEVNNPDEVTRPDQGSIWAVFTAKVTDYDSQSNIDQVLIRVIDENDGESAGSPLTMFDDGSTYEDAVAADSVYTIRFPVDADNSQPTRNFSIEYFAIDLGGLISDTLETSFTIKRNN